MVLGGGLVLVGMCFSPFLPLTAQSNRFGYITCSGLTVVDTEGKKTIDLSTFDDGEHTLGGQISVYGYRNGNRAGSSVVLRTFAEYATVEVRGKEASADLSALDGALITVSQNHGISGVRLSSSENGGRISVFGKDENTADRGRVVLATDEHGGSVVVRGKDEIKGEVYLSEDGQVVIKPGKKAKGGVRLGIDGYGGLVNITGKSEEASRVLLGVNQYGNGSVNTWDKDGYRQK